MRSGILQKLFESDFIALKSDRAQSLKFNLPKLKKAATKNSLEKVEEGIRATAGKMLRHQSRKAWNDCFEKNGREKRVEQDIQMNTQE